MNVQTTNGTSTTWIQNKVIRVRRRLRHFALWNIREMMMMSSQNPVVTILLNESLYTRLR
jgi:hypothetical protein